MYKFVLKNINDDEINSEFGLVNKNKSDKISTIDSLFNKESDDMVIFINHSKSKVKCTLSTVNLSKTSNLSCYWCRHALPENTLPVTCPIKHVSGSLLKSYSSSDNKQNFVISENVSSRELESIMGNLPKRTVVDNNPYFITDGIFCSFNCCVAFITDNNRNSLYDESYSLLLRMYKSIMGKDVSIIRPAPHWRTLLQYGGWQNILQFRDTLSKIEYVPQDYVLQYKPVSFVYHKKFSF